MTDERDGWPPDDGDAPWPDDAVPDGRPVEGDLGYFEPPRMRRRVGCIALSGWLVALVLAGAGVALVANGTIPLPDIAALFPSATPTEVPTTPPTARPASPTPAGSPTFVRPTPTPGPTFLVHVVGRGETLLTIAREYDTSGRSLAYWNRGNYPSLDPDSPTYAPDRIEVGWVLFVLPGQEVDPGTPPTNLPTLPASPSPEPPPG